MRILIAGVHPIFCQGLAAIIATILKQDEKKENIHVLLGDDVFNRLHADLADWFLLDIGNTYDIEQLEAVCKPIIEAGKKVTLFTDITSPGRIRDIITRIGVSGVILKQSGVSLVLSALRLIQVGGRYLPELVLESKADGFAEAQAYYKGDDLEEVLTPRQMEVLEEVGKGRSNQQIAHSLTISVATVKLHVNAILQALDVNNRTEAALLLYKAKESEKRKKRHTEEQAEIPGRPMPLPTPMTNLDTSKLPTSTPVFDMSE